MNSFWAMGAVFSYIFRLPERLFAIRCCIDLRHPNKLLTQFIWRLLRQPMASSQ
ncbi:MAG: hypothetical protein J6W29_03525 [Neisseriaceae bacterium]|nr:hypothetical protein [Neisseriaceae bacterium]MBP5789286.1 hypothetical protein [Neisseriaceae bacterium]